MFDGLARFGGTEEGADAAGGGGVGVAAVGEERAEGGDEVGEEGGPASGQNAAGDSFAGFNQGEVII